MTDSAASYRLDELGWLQFERLCELLLLAEAGLTVDGWQGHADECRRVAISAPLAFRGVALGPGPVGVALFWCRHDPATGNALPDPAERWSSLLDDPALERLAQFLVCVNLDAEKAGAMLRPVLPTGAGLTVCGSRELSESIDAHPEIRAAFPSLLGLRERGSLTGEDARARSSFDVDEAQRLARVFWPTRAYGRARVVLQRHGFVVLTGPPEMGKTAIAAMIALAQLSDGWEAHACTDPDEVHRAFDPERRQVFIADDAFGSTEYRPDAAERWAVALAELLRMLDPRHWLIWTSRPAPLRTGLSRIQRERGAERFPSPAEVLVDASDLDLEEKTLILFRHAKSAGVAGPARRYVQSTGMFIVEHPHFTPERIRRFVADYVGSWITVQDDLSGVADRVLSSPTDAMRNSFNALEREHRDLLVALLDAPAGLIDERQLAASVRRHHPGGLSRSPSDLIDRLTDHFLRVTPLGIGWVHPSWRDLVIDQLREDAAGRQGFLAACGIEGAALALSQQGGTRGERSLPLLKTDADWDQLLDRLCRLLPELEPRDMARLLLTLSQSIQELADPHQRLEAESLAGSVLNDARERWNRLHTPLPAFVLDAWYRLADNLPGACAPPRIAATWAELHPGARVIEDPDREELLRADEWLAVAQVLRDHDAATLTRLGFYGRDHDLLRRLILSLAQRAAEHADIRPLTETVLERVRNLCPDLANEAAGALTLTELAQAVDASDWWTPGDLTTRPSDELVATGNHFARVDIGRVLEDL
ncbi:MAG: hypothetical protein ACRDLT_02245 [Solirubrobacteraceae bacterium]